MTIVATAVIVAVVVAAVTWAVANRVVVGRLNREIGGRTGADPIAEHQRQLAEVQGHVVAAEVRASALELSLDALSSGVVVTDGHCNVLVRNQLVTTMAERSHEKTLLDATISQLLDVACKGRRAERELEIFGPPSRTLAVHAVPVFEQRNVVGALAVIDDVTDARRVEKTRRDFVANLSHELRTPVGAASLLGEMLADEVDPEVRTQLTGRLLNETERMTATIDDLLELSRIESAEQPYDDQVDVERLVNEALARTRVAAEAKEISVGSVMPPTGTTLRGNRDQLLTALVNLIENAVKYSSPGDAVSVRARLEDDAMYLVVQDSGRGIPARDLDRIFERFYRVDRSRDTTTGGTGIGLSIVRHVALNHGATVEVASFEGDGSTFTMVFPAANVERRRDREMTPEVVQ